MYAVLATFAVTKKITMDQFEQLRAGEWIYGITPEIGNELLRAEDMCFRLNNIPPSHKAEREAVIKELLGYIGPGFFLHSPFRCDFGFNISIGENFVGNYNITILDEAEVVIGDNVFIGPNVGIYTITHALQPMQRNKGIMRAMPVRIGNNVWIGAGAVILPGVEIGDNAVIGAGSVVTRNVPASVLAAGNPCRTVRPVEDSDYVVPVELK